MKQIKQYLLDAWTWVREKACYSWTMRGAVLAVVLSTVDSVIPFLPESLQNKPLIVGMSVVFAVLRSRSL